MSSCLPLNYVTQAAIKISSCVKSQTYETGERETEPSKCKNHGKSLMSEYNVNKSLPHQNIPEIYVVQLYWILRSFSTKYNTLLRIVKEERRHGDWM